MSAAPRSGLPDAGFNASGLRSFGSPADDQVIRSCSNAMSQTGEVPGTSPYVSCAQLLLCTGAAGTPVFTPLVAAGAPIFTSLVAAYTPLVTPSHSKRLGLGI